MNLNLHSVGIFIVLVIINNLPSTEAGYIGNPSGKPGTYDNLISANKSQHVRCSPVSQFFLRKMRTYFCRRDSDGDGIFSKKEYDQTADRFANISSAKLEDKCAIRQKINELFNNYAKVAGEGGRVTEEVVVEAFLSQRNRLLSNDALPTTFKSIFQVSFSMLDTDHNGRLTVKEYIKLLFNIGVRHFETIGRYSFDSVDKNHDRCVTTDEFTEGLYEFYFSDDEYAPGTLFMGPLV